MRMFSSLNSDSDQKKTPNSPTKYYADCTRHLVDRDMKERDAEERMDTYRHYENYFSSQYALMWEI